MMPFFLNSSAVLYFRSPRPSVSICHRQPRPQTCRLAPDSQLPSPSRLFWLTPVLSLHPVSSHDLCKSSHLWQSAAPRADLLSFINVDAVTNLSSVASLLSIQGPPPATSGMSRLHLRSITHGGLRSDATFSSRGEFTEQLYSTHLLVFLHLMFGQFFFSAAEGA